MADTHPSLPDLSRFVAVDIGSTTTKALYFHQDPDWTFVRAETPTTVEKPHEDVTIGVLDALKELEAKTSDTLVQDSRPSVPLLATSSAGGGLAMVVAGLVSEVTTQSARRVALGAGAVLQDVLALDDGRPPYQKIQQLHSLRPDVLLLAGGFDGGAVFGPVFLAELFREAGLRPKIADVERLPLIFAGNVSARPFVKELLEEDFLYCEVPNLRPSGHEENLEPTREAIHEVFLQHVMSQAPGYGKLIDWTAIPPMPTPAAVGRILELISRRESTGVMAIDIGGATTDVFSARAGAVDRTVSANLGMSYSLLNVVRQAGIDSIAELLPADSNRADLLDQLGNKHLHPTSLPQSLEALEIECAAASVAIREAVREHLNIIRGERLSRDKESLGWHMFSRKKSAGAKPACDIGDYGLIIGSGGKLSHSPRRSAAAMLINGLEPANSIRLAVDSAFMFPHLGILSQLDEALALQLLDQLGLIPLEPPPATDRPVSFGLSSEDLDKVPRRRATAGATVTVGEIHEPRRLAIGGVPLVKRGDTVTPETAVAQSTRDFRRPFFLNVSDKLKVSPDRLDRYLHKSVGDDIAVGEEVARNDDNPLQPLVFRSTVAGTVERILPNGVLIVRERDDFGRLPVTVNLAEELNLNPERALAKLSLKVGQDVEKGQLMAKHTRNPFFGPSVVHTCTAPIRGTISLIEERRGLLQITPPVDETTLTAWVGGTVVSVDNRGCDIAANGTLITGMWGVGKPVVGKMVRGETRSGDVVLSGPLTGEGLRQLAAAGVSAVITPSVPLDDIENLHQELTVVILVGFGRADYDPGILRTLEAGLGKTVSVDPTTQLRAGVVRPRVFIPE